jgi:hypothetical protein
MHMNVIVLTGILVLASATAANAACQMYPMQFFLGFDAQTASISDGGPCASAFTAASPTVFETLAIATQPTHGKLTVTGLKARYQPAKGFKGNDRYQLRLCGKRHNNPECSTLSYDVTVQ